MAEIASRQRGRKILYCAKQYYVYPGKDGQWRQEKPKDNRKIKGRTPDAMCFSSPRQMLKPVLCATYSCKRPAYLSNRKLMGYPVMIWEPSVLRESFSYNRRWARPVPAAQPLSLMTLLRRSHHQRV